MYYKVVLDEIVEREDNPFPQSGFKYFDSKEEAIEYFTNPVSQEVEE